MIRLFILISLIHMTIATSNTIHQFSIRALNSQEVINFSDYDGKKILLVNVASKCGFTGQYKGLEELYQQNKDHLVVIGLPCNQFLMQEPGSEEKIAAFCEMNFGVTFPMTEKIKVRGSGIHPIFKWLTKKELNGVDDFKVSWNFNKFLLDEEGNLIGHFPAKVGPLDEELTSLIK